MLANYGYIDGTGEYYIIVDTNKCNGCGRCIDACPASLFRVTTDDYEKEVAEVKPELVTKVSHLCPGHSACAKIIEATCQRVCEFGAISHAW